MEKQHHDLSIHDQHQLRHDAITDVLHDAACRCHASRYQDRLEGALHLICQEVTDAARLARTNVEPPPARG